MLLICLKTIPDSNRLTSLQIVYKSCRPQAGKYRKVKN
nr:MAG TPA: hypothetical protein [Caudoviricetes sp.]